MLERAIQGSSKYWGWVIFLLVVIGAAFGAYLYQFHEGLQITGLTRNTSWGFYIAQLTFMVGVAASAVMLVLPYYLHNYKKFGRLTVLGEFLAVAAVNVCLLSVIVDLGQPDRLLNMFIYLSPKSILFWDATVLNAYMGLNLIIAWIALGAERKQVAPPKWIKPLIYLSIPLAVSIHTVTAFLYCGLPGRGFWLTAILAPRFLASAFAAGPSLLVLLMLLVRKVSKFDPGKEAIQNLGRIITYAICLNVFFFLLEVFVAFYSGIPEHTHHLTYLFVGHHGANTYVPWMWAAYIFMFTAIIMLLPSKWRANETHLAICCALVFAGTYIDKGLGMIAGGFTPNPFGEFTEYVPTGPEILIAIGCYAVGALILTILYKMALDVKVESELDNEPYAPH